MKNLTLISFVGVDENTLLDSILEMESVVPCEFSVLYSDSKSQTNHTRYPSLQFCNDFLQWGLDKGVITSLHLCGSVIQRYVNQEKDVMDLCAKASRIQLNINIKDFPDYEQFSDDIINVIKNHGHDIIMQQNKTKALFNKVFLAKVQGRINLLYDGSGGFGREISDVQSPTPDHFTGYAGGIKPENVKRIVNLIESKNPNNLPYYIDMESGIRENNFFSIEKCLKLIQNLQ